MTFEIPTGPFTEAELKAAKEQGIVPAWLRRILQSYKDALEAEGTKVAYYKNEDGSVCGFEV